MTRITKKIATEIATTLADVKFKNTIEGLKTKALNSIKQEATKDKLVLSDIPEYLQKYVTVFSRIYLKNIDPEYRQILDLGIQDLKIVSDKQKHGRFDLEIDMEWLNGNKKHVKDFKNLVEEGQDYVTLTKKIEEEVLSFSTLEKLASIAPEIEDFFPKINWPIEKVEAKELKKLLKELKNHE